ncbi:MAG: FAD-dependent monooxygenase [Burkholderiaceae bacterium]|jgi:2-polyprenyl-6-methoxyphenol hydroxylase-like FAD-dependent oxidoreductase
MAEVSVDILIAGGGSVGLALASELGWRGGNCALVEPLREPNPHPRANAVANRTMEYFRRWGVDKFLVDAGIASNMPATYFWVTSLHGKEIHRLVLPGQRELERMRMGGMVDPKTELHWSPYLKTTVGQDKVETVLRAHVATRDSVRSLYGYRLFDFVEDEAGVTSHLATDEGERLTVRSRWLVGCDGGRSVVREKLGTEWLGRAGLSNFVSIYFRAPTFLQCHGFGPANIFFPLHKKHRGFLLNWDHGVSWTYHLILDQGTDWQSIDPVQTIFDLLGCNTEVEVMAVQPWSAHALTADRYVSDKGRVFIAGDAAHLFSPTGGLGMNTGVSDAIDLAWKLQALAEGWGGPGLSKSYDAERRPIGERNTREAADNFDRLFSVMQFGDELDSDDADGAKLRAELRRELQSQEKLLKSSGVLLGYRYNNSPLCIADDSLPTDDDPQKYIPVARPGHRAPHAWLKSRTGSLISILDLFGPWFTLLCFRGLGQEFKRDQVLSLNADVPMEVVNITEPEIRQLYGDKNFVLVRPDLMVAWRGDSLRDIAKTLAVASGW